MVLRQYAPSPALAPFICRYEIVETGDAMTRTLLPDTSIIVAFRYSGFAVQLDASTRRLPNAAIVGLRSSTRRMYTSANGGIVLAKFRAAGAASFVPEPLHHLFGETRALDELFDARDVASASSQIINATSDTERIASVEEFLLAHHRLVAPDPVVSTALGAIAASAGAVRVSDIARDLHASYATLERRFRRVVGASPKQFASLVRLRQAVDLAQQGSSLTTLAMDAGYYDQSHFIRDFRVITGIAPGRFFDATEYC